MLGLKCYTCVSSRSMSDCKKKMNETDCSIAGSNFDRCASMSVDMETSGVRVKSYVKSCYTKSGCESAIDAFKQCKNIEGATCEFSCCGKDGCNGGKKGAQTVVQKVTQTAAQWLRSALP